MSQEPDTAGELPTAVSGARRPDDPDADRNRLRLVLFLLFLAAAGFRIVTVPAVVSAQRIAWDRSISGGAGPNVVARLTFAFYARRAVIMPFDSTRGDPAGDADLVASTRRWDGTKAGLSELVRVPGKDIVLWTRNGAGS